MAGQTTQTTQATPNRLKWLLAKLKLLRPWLISLWEGFKGLWKDPQPSPARREEFPEQRIKTEELRRLVSQRLEHENNFMDHRLNWLLAIYAFAGAAIGVLRADADGPDRFLILVICTIGFFASWSALSASSHARAARRGVRRILEGWTEDTDGCVGVGGESLSALMGAGVDEGGYAGLFSENLSRPLQPWWGLPLTGFVGWPIIAGLHLLGLL